MAPVLTRYLYHRDEVCHSLLTCLLLKKNSFKEALFWTSEIYYSGYQEDIWELLWKIYYDFFAICNPKFEKKIKRAYIKWQKDSSIEYIVTVVNLLYHCSTLTPTVFRLRILKVAVPTSIYLGRTPKWIASLKLSKKERGFIRSIHKKKFDNISYYCSQISSDLPRCYEIVWQYFTSIKGYSLKKICYKDIPYRNKLHILLTLICYLMMESKEEIAQIRKIALVRKLEKESIEFFQSTNVLVEPAWKTLPQRRLYAIQEWVGAFPLKRADNNIEWNKILWYYWEYYARKCPLWKKRFDEYNVCFNENEKSPVFPNDDLLEEFYEKYGLEPDEQSRDCQEKSLCKLPKKTFSMWINSIFPGVNIEDNISKQQLVYFAFRE